MNNLGVQRGTGDKFGKISVTEDYTKPKRGSKTQVPFNFVEQAVTPPVLANKKTNQDNKLNADRNENVLQAKTGLKMPVSKC